MNAVAEIPRRRALVALPLLLAVLITGLLLLRAGMLEGPIQSLSQYVHQTGPAGVLVFCGVYVAWVVALLPGFLLTMAAGMMFGPLKATALVLPVQTLAVALAFLASRYLFRDFVEERTGQNPRLRAIGCAIEERGFLMVALLRLSPVVPYNVLNYALGATRVRFGPYVAGSLVGMIPGTFLYAYLGASLQQLGAGTSGDPVQRAVHAVGLAATVLIAVTATVLARNALQSALKDPKLISRDADGAD